MKGRQFSNEEIINGISTSNNLVLISIYKNFKLEIVNYIVKNGGNEFDADEAFQIALINIKRKIDKKRIDINLNFKSYLFTTAVRIWIEGIKKEKNEKDKLTDYSNVVDMLDIIDLDFESKHSLNPMLRSFNLLQDDCKDIFYMQAEGFTYKEIAQEFDISNDYIKVKRKRCYEILLNAYKQTIEDENRK